MNGSRGVVVGFATAQEYRKQQQELLTQVGGINLMVV